MNNQWYLIANSAIALIYHRDYISDELVLRESLVHPESRLKGSDISTDRPGHNHSAGNGQGAMVEKTDPKSAEIERFAREVNDYLEKARSTNQFDELCIAASPAFHGLLNKHMKKHVANMVNHHIEKDLTHAKDLDQSLRQYM